MKNSLWYMVYYALMIVQIVVLGALLLNAVIPIVMVLTWHGFTWLWLYLCLPIWITVYMWLDNVIEDL